MALQEQVRLCVHTRQQRAVRVRDIDFGMHGPGFKVQLFGEAGDMAGEGSIERWNLDIHGLTNPDSRGDRFGDGQNETKDIVLAEANQGFCLRV